MKRSLKLFAMLILSGVLILLASCKGNEHKQSAADNTPPPTTGAVDPTPNKTAVPTEAPTSGTEPTIAPDTELPTPEHTSLIEPRPENVTIEWLAGELWRRYYIGCIELELSDYSDIMDRNENTDLFFYDNRLEIERIILGQGYKFLSVDCTNIEIQHTVSETDAELTVDLYVLLKAPIDLPEAGEFIGHNFQLTIDKQQMIIVSYAEPSMCSSRYTNRLKPLAMRYRDQGMTWEEADKLAFNDIVAEYKEDALLYPIQTP